jgi:hypothetical protein
MTALHVRVAGIALSAYARGEAKLTETAMYLEIGLKCQLSQGRGPTGVTTQWRGCKFPYLTFDAFITPPKLAISTALPSFYLTKRQSEVVCASEETREERPWNERVP